MPDVPETSHIKNGSKRKICSTKCPNERGRNGRDKKNKENARDPGLARIKIEAESERARA